MSTPITWLYVPGDRPERFDKAVNSGADVVILDLEDAVSPPAKATARENVVTYLAGPVRVPGTVRLHVRVNDVTTPDGTADVAAVREVPGLAALRVPKVESTGGLDHLAGLLGDSPPPVYALLESAVGIENAGEIARHDLVAGIALGEADLHTQLGISDDTALTYLRVRAVVAAAAAGLPPVAMSVYTDIKDMDGLAASCAAGRCVGMLGRTAIHPRQLPVIRRAFTPSEREVEHAREVLAAADEAAGRGHGAVALPDGRFVDAPIVTAARHTLELADQLAAHPGSAPQHAGSTGQQGGQR